MLPTHLFMCASMDILPVGDYRFSCIVLMLLEMTGAGSNCGEVKKNA